LKADIVGPKSTYKTVGHVPCTLHFVTFRECKKYSSKEKALDSSCVPTLSTVQQARLQQLLLLLFGNWGEVSSPPMNHNAPLGIQGISAAQCALAEGASAAILPSCQAPVIF
jgi:hypothetical protein